MQTGVCSPSMARVKMTAVANGRAKAKFYEVSLRVAFTTQAIRKRLDV